MALKPNEIEGELNLNIEEKGMADGIEQIIDAKLKEIGKGKTEYKITVSRENGSYPEVVKREVERRYNNAGWNATMETDSRYQGDYGPIHPYRYIKAKVKQIKNQAD